MYHDIDDAKTIECTVDVYTVVSKRYTGRSKHHKSEFYIETTIFKWHLMIPKSTEIHLDTPVYD